MTIILKLETTSNVIEVEIQILGPIEFIKGRAIFTSTTGAKYEVPAEAIIRIRPLDLM